MRMDLSQFFVEPLAGGVALTGVGRLVAEPCFSIKRELVIEVAAVTSARDGLAITLGDDSSWIVAGWGVRYTPRDRGAKFDRTILARHDGLWITSSGLPRATLLKPLPDPKAVKEDREGRVVLRLVATREGRSLKLALSRVVAGRAVPIAEGVIADASALLKSPLQAGVLATGYGDEEGVLLEHFAITPR